MWKAANDTNEPKRPVSPFFKFMEEFRIRFQEENPHNISIAAIGKAGGIQWRAMSDAVSSACLNLGVKMLRFVQLMEKAPYVAEADKMKIQYEKNMAAYNKNKKHMVASDDDDDDDDEEEEEEEDEDDDDEDEDPRQTRSTHKGKKVADSLSKGKGSLTDIVFDNTTLKEKEIELKQLRMKLFETKIKREEAALALLAEQREAIREEQIDRDIQSFIKPHDNIPEPLLQIVLKRKREIAAKHGWTCNF